MNPSNKPQLWAEIIEQQSQSELSIIAFCKENQLTVNTFYYWRKKLYGGVQQQMVHPVLIEDSPKGRGEHPSVMLSLPTGMTVEFLTDMRKSIDGLSLIVADVLEMDPFSEAWFIFCNRGRDKIKILFWDTNGFWLYYRRLEKGRFKWPNPNAFGHIAISRQQLQWLLSGLNLEHPKAHQPLYGLEV